MKKVVAAMALVLGCTLSAWAMPYPVSVGSTVKMYIGDTAAQYEGNYQAVNQSSGVKFGTFCLELNETFYDGGTYYVQSISDSAVAGGVGGSVSGADPLRNATKWLYSNFLAREIFNVTGKIENDYSMQLAIWFLEDELTAFPTPSTFNNLGYIKAYKNDLTAQTYVAKALEAEANNAFVGNVKAMNLVDAAGNLKQSHLVGTVPEPSTFVLLGAGLLGAALYRRKKQN